MTGSLRKRKLRPGLQIFLHDIQTPLKSKQLQHYSPWWDLPEGE